MSYAALWFDKPNDLLSVMHDIERMCQQNQIDSLNLRVFHCEQMNLIRIFNRIRYLSNIKSFHFDMSQFLIDEDIFVDIPVQLHIKTLCFKNHSNEMLNLNRIYKLFPNLEELYIYNHLNENSQDVIQVIYSIASQNKNLKCFHFYIIYTHDILILNDDLIEINAAGANLEEPTLLTIQTNADVTDTTLEFISITKSTQSCCLPCQMFGSHGLQDYVAASAYLKTFNIDTDEK